MIERLLKLPPKHTYFLFGPRQTGKSTLLSQVHKPEETLTYSLLKTEEYVRLSANPALFREEVSSRDRRVTHVIVDEVQRVPDLLNEVHHLMEGPSPPCFALSGSSARKLKRGHANLLAGRAWTYHLYPLTHIELGSRFSLDQALRVGTLPSVYLSESESERARTLKAYVETYLKEEIQQEALVRNLGGFLRFLPLAADANGCVVNYSNIARETGLSYNTIKEYFQILEDTLIGFLLLPYSGTPTSRRRLAKHPKFYFFDTGIHRALAKKAGAGLERKTSEYGAAFEHFVILEAIRLAAYKELDLDFSFYRSASGAEVDLILRAPDGKISAIEIKSTENPDESALRGLKSFLDLCPKAETYVACLAPRKRKVSGVSILPWQEVLENVLT